MMRSLLFQLHILMIGLAHFACKGDLNQKFESQQRECGASWVKDRLDTDFYTVVDELGEQIPVDQIIGYWISPGSDQALRLDVSPKGCVAVPQSTRQGLVLVGRLDTRAMAGFPLTEIKREEALPKLQLQPKQNLKLNLNCAPNGIFSQSETQVNVSISLNGQALSRQEAEFITRLYRITVQFKEQAGNTPVADYKLADWTQWEAAPALKLIEAAPSTQNEANSISILQLLNKPGNYYASLEWSNFLGEKFAQDNPAICPIVIDREAPPAPGTSIPSIDQSPFVPTGSRLPIAVSEDSELHYQVQRIASQELYKKWSSLSSQEKALEVFEKGELPIIERGGLYRLRAYAQDKSGNRSEVIEKILNVIEPPATRDTLADGWQILKLNDGAQNIMAGPRWNGTAYVLAWADLNSSNPQTIQLTDLPIKSFPTRLASWQVIRSVKGNFGIAGNRNEEICFYRQGVYVNSNEQSQGRIQCFGWNEGKWKVLTDQEFELWDNEDLMAARVDGDDQMDFLIHDHQVGLVRGLMFRAGKLTLTPEYSTNNLGAFGVSRGRIILPMQANNFAPGMGASQYLMLDPAGYQGICYGTKLVGQTGNINESRDGVGLGEFYSESTGLSHPLEKEYWFPALRSYRSRVFFAPDFRGISTFDLAYVWNDKTRKFTAWTYHDCLRQFTNFDAAGLPDLFGKRISFYKSKDGDAYVFNAIVYPLNSTIAEPLTRYRFNGRSWDFVGKVENPATFEQQAPEHTSGARSSYPDTLESPWVDRTEASRQWGTLSVQQGDALPFQVLPGYVGYYRWTALSAESPDKGSESLSARRKRGPWQSGPWPYPQLLGTFLFELRVQPLGEAEPGLEQTADLRRLVSVLPPLSPSRSVMSGLSALVQIKPGQALVKVTPKTWSSRPGYVQWAVETIENKSTSQLIELEAPWDLDSKFSFFAQQQLAIIVGRFGMADNSSETICYVRKAPVRAIAEKGRMACLGFADERWQWLVKDAEIEMESQDEFQTLELAADGLGTFTHLLRFVPGKRAAMVGKWDALLQTFVFGNLPCNFALYEGPACVTGTWNRAAAYPTIVREPKSDQDAIIANFPYDVDRYQRGNIYVYGKLSAANNSYAFSRGSFVRQSPHVEPFPSAWQQTQFDGSRMIYGRRYLRTQIIPVALAEDSFFIRLRAPGEDFTTAFQIWRDPARCNGGLMCYQEYGNLAETYWRPLTNPDIQTFTTKIYKDQEQKEQNILVVTPMDPHQDYQFYRWNCEGQSCSWSPFLSLPYPHALTKETN